MKRLAVTAAAACALLLPAAPASALIIPVGGSAPPPPIIIADNGGALVTRSTVHPGEVLTHGGTAYTVEKTQCADGTCELILAPQLPSSDWGRLLVFVPLPPP